MSGCDDLLAAAAAAAIRSLVEIAPPIANGRMIVGVAKVSELGMTDCLKVGVNPACVGSTGVSVHAAIATIAARAIRERLRMQHLGERDVGNCERSVTLGLCFGRVKRFLFGRHPRRSCPDPWPLVRGL